MKHTFNPNKINIFTKVPDDHDFNITKYIHTNNDSTNMFNLNCVVRNKCIDSWKKIPNADIHIFTTQDIKDTFPGMIENDPFYQITVNTPFKHDIDIDVFDCEFTNKTEGSNMFLKRATYTLPANKECCFSTDIIRYKLAKAIPNSIYMDSDIFVRNASKISRSVLNCSEKTLLLFGTQGFYSKNNTFYDKMIEGYNKFINEYGYKLCYDSAVFQYIERLEENKVFFHDSVIVDDMFPNLYHFCRTKNYWCNYSMLSYIHSNNLKNPLTKFIYVRNYDENKQKFINYIFNHNYDIGTIFFLQTRDVYNSDETNRLNNDIKQFKFYIVDDDSYIPLHNLNAVLNDVELKQLIIFKFKSFYNIDILNISIIDMDSF